MRRDAYGIVCRLIIDGRDGEPFSLTTRPAPPPWPGRAEHLRAAARERGLSVADRATLAEARRLGPAARTRSTGPTTGPAVNPTSPTENPTGDPMGGPSTEDLPSPGPGVQPPPATRIRPPLQRAKRK